MAEALGVIGGAAAALQIAEGLLKIASRIARYCKTIQNMPEDVEDIEMQIRIYSNNLTQCHDLTTQALERMESKGQNTQANNQQLQDLERQGRRIHISAQRLLDNVKIFKRGKVEAFINRLRWLFRQTEVIHLRMALNLASNLLGNFISRMTWEDLLSRLKECKDPVVKVYIRRRLRFVQNQVKSNVAAQKRLRRKVRQFENTKELEPDVKMTNTVVEDSAKELERRLEELDDSNHISSVPRRSHTPPSHRTSSPIRITGELPNSGLNNDQGSSSRESKASPRSTSSGWVSSSSSPIATSFIQIARTETDYSSIDNTSREHELGNEKAVKQVISLSSESELANGIAIRTAAICETHGNQDGVEIRRVQDESAPPESGQAAEMRGMRVHDDGRTLRTFEGPWPSSITAMELSGTDDGPHAGPVQGNAERPSSLLTEGSVREKPTEEIKSTKRGAPSVRQSRPESEGDKPILPMSENSDGVEELAEENSSRRRHRRRMHAMRQGQNEDLGHRPVSTEAEGEASQRKSQLVESHAVEETAGRPEGIARANSRAAKVKDIERKRSKPTGIVLDDLKKDDRNARKGKQARHRRDTSDADD